MGVTIYESSKWIGGKSYGGLLSSSEIFDPASGSFVATSSMNSVRSGHTATKFSDGRVLIVGGKTDHATELYNPATGQFSLGDSMDSARYNHTATLLQNGKLLIAGGTNNGTALQSAVTYQPGLDVFMTSVSGPAAAKTGETITVTNTVAASSAGGSTVAFFVGIYLSTDSVCSTSDLYLGREYLFAGLASGQSSTFDTVVTIPAGLDPTKSYYICAYADYWPQIVESNEDNNGKAADNTIAIIASDLTVTSVSGPAAAKTGETITVTNTVTASAAGGSAAPFFVGIYLSTDAVCSTSDLYLGREYLFAGLASGQSSTFDTVVTIPAGLDPTKSYYICAYADYWPQIVESNEDNNGRVGNEVSLKPIVTIISPKGPTNDNTPLLSYTVSDGTVVVKVDGNVVNKVSGDSLNTLADGTYKLRVEATDTTGALGFAESDFTVDTLAPFVVSIDPANGAVNVPINKTIVVTFSEPVVAGPNLSGITLKKGKILIVTTVTVSGNTLLIDPVADLGKGILYTLSIPSGAVKDLVGNLLANGSTSSFTTSNATPLAVTTASLANGTIGQPYSATLTATGGVTLYSWSISGTLPAGLSLNSSSGAITGTPTTTGTSNFTVKVTDSTGVIATKDLSITILEPSLNPDLIVSDVSGPSRGTRGTSVTLTATVKNQGGVNSGASAVTFYLSTDATITTCDIKVSDKAVGTLTAGGSQTVSVSYTLPTSLAAVKYYVGAIADRAASWLNLTRTTTPRRGTRSLSGNARKQQHETPWAPVLQGWNQPPLTSLDRGELKTPSNLREEVAAPPLTRGGGGGVASAIATAAADLNDWREKWLNPEGWLNWEITPEEKSAGFPARPVPKQEQAAAWKKRTLTNLYNEMPAGLKLRQEALDKAVVVAYSWSDYTPDGG